MLEESMLKKKIEFDNVLLRCKQLYYNAQAQCRHFNFCPYCGKKIKVVE